MYSRSTERRGRTNLPPGYDGSAFRHDTGERRSFAEYPTAMKIHGAPEGQEDTEDRRTVAKPQEVLADMAEESQSEPEAESKAMLPEKEKEPHGSFFSGMLDSFGKEEWLLLFLILLLLADGSDAWEVILLLVVLLAVR